MHPLLHVYFFVSIYLLKVRWGFDCLKVTDNGKGYFYSNKNIWTVQIILNVIICQNSIYSVIFLYCYFSLQTWLADWLMNNNPNKPKISDGTVVEDAAVWFFLFYFFSSKKNLPTRSYSHALFWSFSSYHLNCFIK